MLTVLGIMAVAGIVLLPVLLPVAATDSNLKKKATTSNSDFDKLSMGNVTVSYTALQSFNGLELLIIFKV